MVSASAFSAILMILIPVYSVLILYYRELWVKVLLRLFPGERKESIGEILSLAITAYFNFIKGMGLVYLIVGILNSIGLLLLGVPYAILFGLIASLLRFIPYVGIIIGSLLPVAIDALTLGCTQCRKRSDNKEFLGLLMCCTMISGCTEKTRVIGPL